MNDKSINDGSALGTMDIHEILKHLPHRYPFLLVDKVLSVNPGVSLTALKNVTINEPYFPGHFPVRPVMPGVLILEAMAQATGLLASQSTHTTPENGFLYYFVGIDEARFKKPVEPGDQLIIEVQVIRAVRNIWRFDATAMVDGELVCSAKIMCAAKELEA
ncbi:MAG: 3-hydroxyacyl-ACP dehydratase FabZ [Gammaproteobacteria bacterium]|nr:3-hydroxyacyl-ACP dehydratase FabZ [Gammaproteobacteria bacterium]